MTEPQTPVPPPPAPFRALRSIGQGITTLILIGVLSPVIGVAALFVPGPLSEPKTIIVAHGANTTEIGIQLAQENAVYLSPLFHIAARLVASGSLKAGEYALPAHASPVDIALMMHEGRSIVRLFTVAEGLTSAEIVSNLKDEAPLTGTIDAIPAEGSLLPETYRYGYGDSRASLIARMQKAMQEKLNQIWATREADNSVRTPLEAVILASIVEKETGKAEERPRIAGVFYNRLHQNMRLQSDPTVIYALTKGKEDLNRPLTHEDLSFASPFNTYASDGLPPQPICNPGQAALEAVAHPEHHHFLYFVANGAGGHAFAADLATHNDNINRWHAVMEKAARHP